jgi:acetylglutamate kinase
VLKEKQLLPRLTAMEVTQLIADKVIIDGMIPKVESALQAVEGGVAAVRITNLAGLQAGTGTTIYGSV